MLVVDDNSAIREFIETVLIGDGYEVASVPDGRAALEIVAQFTPTLILLDLEMPGLNGQAFVAAYRQLPGPHAPILVISAAPDAAEQAARLRTEGILSKPFRVPALLAAVERHAPPRAA